LRGFVLSRHSSWAINRRAKRRGGGVASFEGHHSRAQLAGCMMNPAPPVHRAITRA